jgi:hypothetical protein
MAVWHDISEGTDDTEAGGKSVKAFLAKAKNDPGTLHQPNTVS